MLRQVHKVTLMIVDLDQLGPDEAGTIIENVRYPNHCISPKVVSAESRLVDWNDEHPLNLRDKWREEFGRMFSASDPTPD